MLDLHALEAALAPIEALGNEERTFLAGEHAITLRVLTPDEEKEVQRYTQEVLGDSSDTEDKGSMMEYLDRFKLAVLSYAIVQIGALDLRYVDTIPTGETLDNGIQVRIPRYEAIRNIMAKWTRPLMVSLFGQYGALLEVVERKAEKAIAWEPADLQSEIERLEKRLQQLREQQGEDAGARNPHAAQVRAIHKFDENLRAEHRNILAAAGSAESFSAEEGSADVAAEVAQPNPEPDPDPEPLVAASSASTSPRPSHSTDIPGARRTAIPAASAPPVRAPEPSPVQPGPPPAEEVGGDLYDSMGDVDAEALAQESLRIAHMREAQMGADHQRAIAEARARALEASKAARRGEAVGHARRRQPPHRQAANMVNAVLDTHADSIQKALPSEGPDGTEAVRMPTQVLSRRVAQKEKVAPPLGERGVDSNLNPRFQHPKKR